MRFLSKLRAQLRHRKNKARRSPVRGEASALRHCRFETMEPRRMLSANPLVLGMVYVEEDTGSDLHGDRFEVRFEGGAPGTELVQLVIDGDQNEPGFSIGDVFFDTVEGGLGADLAGAFQIEELITARSDARVEAHVIDGQSQLTLDLFGFQAGDLLVFSIDVDEVVDYDSEETDLQTINHGFDPITSGVEFQSSQLTAEFTAPHYQNVSAQDQFWNWYDDALEASGLDLPADDENGLRDRTAAAFLGAQQQVDPATISGYVYADSNNDGVRDPGELGISNVTVQVIPVDTIEFQNIVTLTTDADGYYEATELVPGSYRVVESVQPSGYLDGMDAAGTVDGVPSGVAAQPGDEISDIFLAGGSRGIEYNFGELLPASIEGTVRLTDADGVCHAGGGQTEPLSGVTVQLWDEAGNLVLTTETDSAGHYAFDNLLPGVYSVIEVTPEGLIDAGARAGFVGSTVRGTALDANTIVEINMNPGEQGQEYDFCEHLPATISGFVYHDQNDNAVREASEQAIRDVLVTLYDESANPLATTHTDAQGFYEFVGLSAGNYRLVESQPDGWLDGQDSVGLVDGVVSGTADSAADTIRDVTLRWGSEGQEYNFGELQPGSLQGRVHAELNFDCVLDPNEWTLQGVQVELLDAQGTVVATTHTTGNGEYRFDNLTPGTYSVREQQPDGYFQGNQRAGSHGGNASIDDLITEIPVGSGQQLEDYNFCEIPPGTLAGTVYLDPNQNETLDPGEARLAGVTVQLFDADQQVVATTVTDSQGNYAFRNLFPDEYAVREQQPEEYFHGGQQAGTAGGDDRVPDLISAIVVGAGQDLTEYNFSELPPSSLSGHVGVRSGPFCSAAAGEPLANIQIELLDQTGTVVATARTDADGLYQFDDLRPGQYAVRETQPIDYFHGGQSAGTGGGDDHMADLISEIQVAAGVELTDYNFCELPPASISGYVFQDGAAITTLDGQVPEDLAAVRDGRRSAEDTPISQVVLELRHGATGEPILASQALPGVYQEGAIHTVTDADGFYEFVGLPSGNYAVYEIHPEGYIDGIDTPGTTSGLAMNPSGNVDPGIISRLVAPPNNDAIILIPLAAGQASQENNFSEVQVEHSVPQLPPPPPSPPEWNPISMVLPPTIGWSTSPQMQPDAPSPIPTFGTAGALKMSWHLSVVNGGMPRSADGNWSDSPWRTVSFLGQAQWTSFAMNDGNWNWPEDVSRMIGDGTESITFGAPGALPISGDFNGDGVSEIGMFYQGHWFIDINGNGRWDEQDLWAQLGGEEDLPVVGDWDGDGKDDIGIFGPEWPGDTRAIKAEPGLPDLQNVNRPTPKNLPPEAAEATDGHRLLKHTASGQPRLDVIDHVFRFGESQDVPVAGDWNGDGISTVGLFRDGVWYLDTDGDGRFTDSDEMVELGQVGDLPVVGDFNGNGIDDLGVFRHGVWHLDTNGTRSLDAHDRVFTMGSADDKPVVGDFDGDGRDDPVTYRRAG